MSDDRPDPPEQTGAVDTDPRLRTAPNEPRRTTLSLSATVHDDRHSAADVSIYCEKTGEIMNLHPEDARALRDGLTAVLSDDGPTYTTVGGGEGDR